MRSRTPVLLLFGAFAVGYNLAVGIHEFGHLFVSWLTRDETLFTWDLLLHPFSVSYVAQNNWSSLEPSVVRWILAGGIGIGTIVPLALLKIVFRRRCNPILRLTVISTAAHAMMLNGLYLVTALIVPWGDAGMLLRLGVPPAWMAVLGVPVVAAWLLLYALLLGEVGLASPNGSSLSTYLVAVGGISIYPVVIVGYQLFIEPAPQVPLAVFVLYALAVAVWMFLAVPVAGRLVTRAAPISSRPPGARVGLLLLAGGFVLVAIELAVGPFRIERTPPPDVSASWPAAIETPRFLRA